MHVTHHNLIDLLAPAVLQGLEFFFSHLAEHTKEVTDSSVTLRKKNFQARMNIKSRVDKNSEVGWGYFWCTQRGSSHNCFHQVCNVPIKCSKYIFMHLQLQKPLLHLAAVVLPVRQIMICCWTRQCRSKLGTGIVWYPFKQFCAGVTELNITWHSW